MYRQKAFSFRRLLPFFYIFLAAVFIPSSVQAKIGTLRGTVTGLGYCDAEPHPLFRASIVVRGTTGRWEVHTDTSGEYMLSVDESENPLLMEVTAPTHSTGTATGVMVIGDNTITMDFHLRWLKPCVSIDRTEFTFSGLRGTNFISEFVISNSGAVETEWETHENPSDIIWVHESPIWGTLPADIGRQPVIIDLDTTLCPGPGEYTASISLLTSDPVHPAWEIRVKLTLITYGIALTAFQNAGWGVPGQRVEYQLRLSNEGTATDKFTLSLGDSPWEANLDSKLVELEAGRNFPFSVWVTVPQGVRRGSVNRVTVTATSQGDPSQKAEVPLNTTAAFQIFLPKIRR